MPQHPPVDEEAVKGSPVKVFTYQPEPTPIDPGGGINPPAGTTRVIVKIPCDRMADLSKNPNFISLIDIMHQNTGSKYEIGYTYLFRKK